MDKRYAQAFLAAMCLAFSWWIDALVWQMRVDSDADAQRAEL